MKKILFILFLQFILVAQNIDFKYWEIKWEKSDDNFDFRTQIQNKIKPLLKDDTKYKFILEQWILRSHYSEAKINMESGQLIALEKYNDFLSNYKNIIYHDPYSDNMLSCKQNKENNINCVCKKMSEQEIIDNNLDFLSPDNINANFADLWILVKHPNNNSYKKNNFDFTINEKKTTQNLSQNINEKSTITNKSKNVKYAILPKIILNNKNQKLTMLEKLNIKAKKSRIKNIRDFSWDYSTAKIKTYNDLQSLDFKDTLKINNTYITDENNNYLYGLKINSYPIIKNSPVNDGGFSRYNKLYIFENENDNNPSRYSFKIEQDKSKNFMSKINKNKVQNNKKDYVVYINWKENWKLKKYIDKNQFIIEIPKFYTEKYDFIISGQKFETIPSTKFKSGIKIKKNRLDIEYTKFDEWQIDKKNYDSLALNGTDLIESDVIEIKSNKIPNNELKIIVKEKDVKKNNYLFWTGISLLGILALK